MTSAARRDIELYSSIVIDPTAWAADTTSIEAKPKRKALLRYRPFTSQHPHLKLRKEWIPREGTQDRVSARGVNGSEKASVDDQQRRVLKANVRRPAILIRHNMYIYTRQYTLTTLAIF